ncbi:winged helix-turn-helix domain-containing protein [Aneurinibacillus thermoaerophilus]|uniref:winged helix-turn-helix domain-containing protein n=1 Tax=Aneurinibacillus thermoaerophilus TaxID=143495 RepID=UPI002E1DEFD2|nr:winged helix-turn-helix domain-containing protein [Aneurinibacillus thermoaerophilus]MED0766258.1 winged helix-turn-helix domain-containing protein [Aneurinibacillus thermoaerophilus]
MKRVKITNTHGWTVKTLRKQERKVKDPVLRARVMAVRLVMEGYLGKEVAAMLNLYRQSVSTYVAIFNQGGLDTLLERKKSHGKEPYLTEEQQAEWKRIILESTPAEQGMGMYALWDTRILQTFLKEKFGVSMTRVGILKMLRRLCLRYTRPTYTLAKVDAKRREAFVTQMNMIKKLDHRGYGSAL